MSKRKRDMAQNPSGPSNFQPSPIYIADSSPEMSPTPRAIAPAAFQPPTVEVEHHHSERFINSNRHMQNTHIQNRQNTHMHNGYIQDRHMENAQVQNGHVQNEYMHSGYMSNCPRPRGYQDGHMLNTHMQNGWIQNEDIHNGYELYRQIQNGHNDYTQNGHSQPQEMAVAAVSNSTHQAQIKQSPVQFQQHQVQNPQPTNDINVYVRAMKRIRQHLQSRGKKALLTAITPIVPPKSRHILSLSNETLINIMQRLAPASSASFSTTCRQLKSLQAVLHEDTHYARAMKRIRKHLSSRGKQALFLSLTSTTPPKRRHILSLTIETLLNIINRLTPISSASFSATCKQLKPLHAILYRNTPNTFSRCLNSLEICRWRVQEVQNVKKQRAALRELVREASTAKQELEKKIKKNQERKNNDKNHMSEKDLEAHEKALFEAVEMEEKARKAVAVLNEEMDSWVWPKRDEADRISSKIIDGTLAFEKRKRGIPALKNGLGALAWLETRNRANKARI